MATPVDGVGLNETICVAAVTVAGSKASSDTRWKLLVVAGSKALVTLWVAVVLAGVVKAASVDVVLEECMAVHATILSQNTNFVSRELLVCIAMLLTAAEISQRLVDALAEPNA